MDDQPEKCQCQCCQTLCKSLCCAKIHLEIAALNDSVKELRPRVREQEEEIMRDAYDGYHSTATYDGYQEESEKVYKADEEIRELKKRDCCKCEKKNVMI